MGMTDREKVIQELDDSLKNQHCGFIDGVGNVYAVSEETIRNVIALLKEYGKPNYEHAEHDGIGCLGYTWCTQDDEPIDACKNVRNILGTFTGW